MGSGATKAKEWAYFEAMKFIDNYKENRSRPSNISEVNESEDKTSDNDT